MRQQESHRLTTGDVSPFTNPPAGGAPFILPQISYFGISQVRGKAALAQSKLSCIWIAFGHDNPHSISSNNLWGKNVDDEVLKNASVSTTGLAVLI